VNRSRTAVVAVGVAVAAVAAFTLILAVTSRQSPRPTEVAVTPRPSTRPTESASPTGEPLRQTEVGVVIDLDSASLTDVEGFTIRTPDGRTVVFRIGELENGVEFPPAHLGVHMADAYPVLVTYVEQDGERVVVRLDDGPAPS
jgi:hypothetical protein